MIVATLPEPTVRPPSRYQTDVLRCANGDFSCDLWGKSRFSVCPCGFGDFVIMVLSLILVFWHIFLTFVISLFKSFIYSLHTSIYNPVLYSGFSKNCNSTGYL